MPNLDGSSQNREQGDKQNRDMTTSEHQLVYRQETDCDEGYRYAKKTIQRDWSVAWEAGMNECGGVCELAGG